MLERKGGLKQMLRQGRVILVLFLSLSLVFTTFTPAFAVSGNKAKTKMKHSPPKYFVPEHRIQLDVRVSDPKGVELVRCYFKVAGESNFVFVPMAVTGKNNYSGVLPAPSPTTEQIEYLFLSVNTENVIVKSQTFVLDKEEKDKVPAWQEIPMEGEIKVSMELDHVPSELTGFSDNIAMDAVESGLRFGIVAGGLYQISTAATASTTGSAASATTAGTISAGTAGMSTAGIVGVGALAAAAAGGAAAAASSSSSSSNDSYTPVPAPAPAPSPAPSPAPAPDLPGGTGEVKVTLQWNNCNDLDLHVTDPCGNKIHFGNKSATCRGKTGTLDVDANAMGNCSLSPAENIFWEEAPRGRYTVEVDYFEQQDSLRSSSYTLTTIVDGQRNTFSGTISEGKRQITSFTY